MNFEDDNLLDQFLQQNHASQMGDSFGLDMSHSNTPVPMNIPGSHADSNLNNGFGTSASITHTANTSNFAINELSESLSSFKNGSSYTNQGPQSRQQSISGQQIDGQNIPASFMDEYLLPSNRSGSNMNNQQIDPINLDETTRNLFDEPMFNQHISMSQTTDDLASNFTEDFVSSLGTSIRSDLMTPVSSFQPQPLNSFDSHSFTQMSSSLRSPSTSYRGTSQLSSSVRSNRGTQGPASSSLASTPKDMNSSSLTQDEKIRRRREFHNAVERRRRELIKAKIKELGTLVPPSLLHFDDYGKKVKPNKGTILKRTIEYMECLRQVLEIQDKKKEELKKKMSELEFKKHELTSNGAISADPAIKGERFDTIPNYSQHSEPSYHSQSEIQTQLHQPQESAPSATHQSETPNESNNSPERIIDGRAFPTINKQDGTLNHSKALQDDLHQFLSGTLMENEDNNKLMFSSRTENPVDLLLEFDG